MAVHDLYKLSEQTVTNSSVVLCMQVPHGYLSNHGHECKNGYALSHSMKSMFICDVRTKGLIHVDGERLMQKLSSDQWTQSVTTTHVSHFESIFSMRVMEETGTPSLEI
eukprot:1846962-Amphidinium_carterae.1